jgi:hypothetical protein
MIEKTLAFQKDPSKYLNAEYLDLQKFNNSSTFGLLYVWAVLNIPRPNWTFRDKIEQVFPHHVIIPLNLG